MSRTWVKVIGVLVSGACVVYFARTAALHWEALAHIDFGVVLLAAAATALLLHLTTYAASARSWQLALELLGGRPGYEQVVKALTLSQIGKYLPGNFGHHAGRVVLATRWGIPTPKVLASMFIDTILVIAAGVVASTPALALMADVAENQHPTVAGVAGAVVATATVVILAAVLSPRVRSAFSRWTGSPEIRLTHHGITVVAHAASIHFLSFLLGGTALFLLCLGLVSPAPAITPSTWLSITGIYAAAWLLGFILPGAPAGLGIREFVLLLGLSPLFGEQTGVAAAALLRVVTTLGDGVAFALGTALTRRMPQ